MELSDVKPSVQKQLKLKLTDAIIEFCQKEAFYIEELKIEGTLCLVSDRSSVLVAQITEQIGNQGNPEYGSDTLQSGNFGKRVVSSGTTNPYTRSGLRQQKKQGHSVTPISARRKDRHRCPFCTKSFRLKHGLKDHINLHTGRKPYNCRFCCTSFSRLSLLCGHVKGNHLRPLKKPGICCACHTRPETLKTSVQLLSDQNNHFTLTQSGLSDQTGADQSSAGYNAHGGATRHMDTLGTADQVVTIDNTINIKEEVIETSAPDGKDPEHRDRVSQGLIDVQNFLQNFDAGKDDMDDTPSVTSAAAEDKAILVATSINESSGHLLQHHGAGVHADPHQTAITAGPPVAAVTSFTGVPIPTQQLPTATLEMLAHMAQASGLPPQQLHQHQQLHQPVQNVSDLNQLLTTATTATAATAVTNVQNKAPPVTTIQQQQVIQQQSIGGSTGITSSTVPTTVTAAPVLKMPSAQSLQRTADGKFQCPFCEKMYNFKHTLKDHINKHMGNRPHTCKHCGDSFTHLASLCAHIKRRHDSQMTSDYQCEICQEKFMNLQSLKQHFTWRHKDVKFSPQKFLECSQGVVRGVGGTAEENTGRTSTPTSSQLQPSTQVYHSNTGGATNTRYSTMADTLGGSTTGTKMSTNQITSFPVVHPALAGGVSGLGATDGSTVQQSHLHPPSAAPMVMAVNQTITRSVLIQGEMAAADNKSNINKPQSGIKTNELAQQQQQQQQQQQHQSSINQPQFPGGFVQYSGHVSHEIIATPTSAPTPSTLTIPHQQQTQQQISQTLATTSPTTTTSTTSSIEPGDETLSLTTHIADYFSEVNLQTEQGLYKYKCKICGNLFKIRNSLYEHLNSHLGKKPYVCATCGDAFTHHSSLHNHTRNKHSQQTRQEREAAFKHSCVTCGKKFRFPSELDRHFKTNPDHDVHHSTTSASTATSSST